MGHYVSIPGGSDQNVHIYGSGTVIAGDGNDSIYIGGKGAITVGAGNDHITLHGSGTIVQYGAGGHDTINLGHGHDTITEAGTATVYGAFGSVTIQGGTYVFTNKGLVSSDSDAKHHDKHPDNQGPSDHYHQHQDTFVGGSHSTHFVGGSSNLAMHGGSHNDTSMGGSGHAMTGGSGHNLSDFASHGVGGTNVIMNFVSGHDKLHLEGQSLSYLQSHGDVTMSHGNTHISLDGGKTTVELKGFSAHDVTTHKL
jgi:hypothetical protein